MKGVLRKYWNQCETPHSVRNDNCYSEHKVRGNSKNKRKQIKIKLYEKVIIYSILDS